MSVLNVEMIDCVVLVEKENKMELNEQIRTQQNSSLRQRVYRAIQSMYKLFKGSSRNIQVVDRYMNIWKPLGGKIQDVVEFPYESKKGQNAEKKNIAQCLFALVTTMIEAWHKHCKDDLSPTQRKKCVETLEALLSKIEFIVSHRLDLPVQGSDEVGYSFKPPKGE